MIINQSEASSLIIQKLSTTEKLQKDTPSKPPKPSRLMNKAHLEALRQARAEDIQSEVDKTEGAVEVRNFDSLKSDVSAFPSHVMSTVHHHAAEATNRALDEKLEKARAARKEQRAALSPESSSDVTAGAGTTPLPSPKNVLVKEKGRKATKPEADDDAISVASTRSARSQEIKRRRARAKSKSKDNDNDNDKDKEREA